MQCNFQVGQKVITIKSDLSDYEKQAHEAARRAGISFPQYGVVYTVRAVYTARRADGSEIAAIRLAEIRNNLHTKFASGEVGEIGFYASCFRPVVERGTDAGMSILREILNKTDQPVREDA